MGRRASHPAGVPFPRLAPLLYCCLHSEVHSPWLGPKAFCRMAPLTSPASPPPPTNPNHVTHLLLLGCSTSFLSPDFALCCLFTLATLSLVFYPSDLPCLQGSGLMSPPRKVMALFLSPAAPHIAHLWPFLWPCQPYFTGLGIYFSKTLVKATLGLLQPGQCLAQHLTQGRCSVHCVE